MYTQVLVKFHKLEIFIRLHQYLLYTFFEITRT